MPKVLVIQKTKVAVNVGKQGPAGPQGPTGPAMASYATKSLMDADLSPGDGEMAYVTNDPTTENNGTWAKAGASGGGLWVKASTDRITKIELNLKANDASALHTGAISFDWIDGFYIYKDTGETAVFSAAKASEFIPLKYGRDLSVYGFFNGNASCCAYDENKVFIESILDSVALGTHAVTLPVGTAYIRLSWLTANAETTASSEDYDLNYDFVFQGLGLVQADIDAQAATFKQLSSLPSVEFIDNYYIFHGTGAAVVSSTFISCDFLKVFPGQKILYTGYLTANAVVAGYDESLNYVEDMLYAPTGNITSQQFTVPDGVYYIRGCSFKTYAATFSLSLVNSFIDIDKLKSSLGVVPALLPSIENHVSINNQGVGVKINAIEHAALTLATIAVGRVPSGGGDPPTIALTNSGLTHPSVVFVPGGWNGYPYWMAATPVFGPISNNEYENPHIFCSLDGETWIEPPGGTNPIDLPPPYPSTEFLSDAHLVLDDDGYLYCFYRGYGATTYNGISLFYKRSLDGKTWSARGLVESTDGLVSLDATSYMMSQCVIKAGSVYTALTAVRSSVSGMTITPQKNQEETFLFRKTSKDIASGFGEFSEDQIISLDSNPWGAGNDPWHIDVRTVGNTYLMLINAGPTGGDTGSSVWLAYSFDGLNYKVVDTALFSTATYRSAIVPVEVTAYGIKCKVYKSNTADGSVDLYNLTLSVS